MIGLVLLQDKSSGFELLVEDGDVKYDSVMPLLMKRYLPTGLIGLGVTSLVAMFMAGQAGNMSSFNAVWTYDIYNAKINKNASREQLVRMGRIATVVGILLSVAGAYVAKAMPTVIDYLQAITSVFLAPSVAVILLGMFSKRITANAAFWAMVIGTAVAALVFVLQKTGVMSMTALIPVAGMEAGGEGAFMAANFWRGGWGSVFSATLAILISLFTRKKPVEELKGYVMGLTEKGATGEEALPFYKKTVFWALVTMAVFVIVNILLW
jgi:SSS family solute:Na+ symporter